MAEIALPTLRTTDWRCCFVERIEMAGSSFWIATVHGDFGATPTHRWYANRAEALAYAAERAEKYGLPLFDFSADGAE